MGVNDIMSRRDFTLDTYIAAAEAITRPAGHRRTLGIPTTSIPWKPLNGHSAPFSPLICRGFADFRGVPKSVLAGEDALKD